MHGNIFNQTWLLLRNSMSRQSPRRCGRRNIVKRGFHSLLKFPWFPSLQWPIERTAGLVFHGIYWRIPTNSCTESGINLRNCDPRDWLQVWWRTCHRLSCDALRGWKSVERHRGGAWKYEGILFRYLLLVAVEMVVMTIMMIIPYRKKVM